MAVFNLEAVDFSLFQLLFRFIVVLNKNNGNINRLEGSLMKICVLV